MGPNPIGLVSFEEEEIGAQIHTEGRPCEDTGRRQQRREETNPVDTLILDF